MNEGKKGTSISRRYALGYCVIILMMVVLFVVATLSHGHISRRYEEELDDLLGLNRLFARVEACNVHLFDAVTYLRTSSLEAFAQEQLQVHIAAEEVWQALPQKWNRDAADLYHTVQTYLAESGALVAELGQYHGAAAPVETQAIARHYGQTQELINFINLSFKDIYSAKLLSTQQMRADITRMDNAFLVVQIALLLLSLLVFVFFYRRVVQGVTRSVKTLTDFARQVEKTPETAAGVQLQTGDELEVFARTFNHMLATIHTQFDQIKQDSEMRQQLQQMEMENMRITSALQSSQLHLLQARINPHFLFNTLNMITQTAYLENAPETARLMEHTAGFLRYNLGNLAKPVQLGEELDNLQDYAFLQQSRFGQRVRFSFEVDPAVTDQLIPCMILQPLVENAVAHGIGAKPQGGAIAVRARAGPGGVVLEVEDDGLGITPKRLKELRASLAQQDTLDGNEHIGLKNVYLRLGLFYGQGVTFDIDSHPGQTLIRITLPRRTQ